MSHLKADAVPEIELDLTKLLGFKRVASSCQDGEQLTQSLDDNFNKIGTETQT